MGPEVPERIWFKRNFKLNITFQTSELPQNVSEETSPWFVNSRHPSSLRTCPPRIDDPRIVPWNANNDYDDGLIRWPSSRRFTKYNFWELSYNKKFEQLYLRRNTWNPDCWGSMQHFAEFWETVTLFYTAECANVNFNCTFAIVSSVHQWYNLWGQTGRQYIGDK